MSILLVLGGNSAIGKACAYEFAAHGWDIIFAGRSGERMQGLADALTAKTGRNAWGVEFDVLEESSFPLFWDTLPAVPTVVLSAVGLYINGGDEELIRRTNYDGPVSIMDYAAERLADGGAVIGISSVAGERIRPANAPYGRAKRALTAYLGELRQRTRGRLDIMTVLPGTVRSPMTEGRDIPAVALAEPEIVGRDVYAAYLRRQAILYTPWFWRYVMAAARCLPQSVFERFTN